ncbi:uncharacterized protein [Macrobrachium rosenbergii]|uniref:uncharacterized protein n=1 Tax=Macrobrachium rosenbergii TaxID=79674 RepID=UPI0034D75C47
MKRHGELTLEELQEAKNKTIAIIQRENFQEFDEGGKKTKTSSCTPVESLPGRWVIRCKGRLEHAQLPESVKLSILLLKSCYVTQVIIKEHYDANAHMGVNATVVSVRQEFWIPQIRQLTKSIIHHCVICRRTQGRPYRPNIVPPLPEFRVQCKQPFNTTGVDYNSALWVKEKKQSPQKAYIILFMCPITRGIYMELVDNQSCDSFLVSFRKFCSRRGFLTLMLSDDATTFVVASEYLKTMSDYPRVKEHLLDIKCNWKFIPARSPRFGAMWERLIGLLKSYLKKIVGQTLLSFEELAHVLVELEGIINDRPLSYTPGDLNQLEILTPNH